MRLFLLTSIYIYIRIFIYIYASMVCVCVCVGDCRAHVMCVRGMPPAQCNDR